MSTSSIIKNFKIKDKQIYEKLEEGLNKPSEYKPSTTNYLEDGKRILNEAFNNIGNAYKDN